MHTGLAYSHYKQQFAQNRPLDDVLQATLSSIDISGHLLPQHWRRQSERMKDKISNQFTARSQRMLFQRRAELESVIGRLLFLAMTVGVLQSYSKTKEFLDIRFCRCSTAYLVVCIRWELRKAAVLFEVLMLRSGLAQ